MTKSMQRINWYKGHFLMLPTVLFQTKFGEPMYQRTDNLFAVISKFSEKFKSAMRDIDKGMERKSSSSSLS